MSEQRADLTGVWTIVVAGGSGSRFGAPKQFLGLGGRRVIDRAIATAAAHSDGVVAVLPADVDLGYTESVATPVYGVVGGESRSASVRNGLAAVPADAEVVLVHDAARPLTPGDVFARVIAAVRDGADAVVPVLDVTDSLRHRRDGAVDRAEFAAVQTPQGFSAAGLRSAHASGADATDDATLVESTGGTVTMVAGDRAAMKLTTPFDLRIAELLLDEGAAE
ncbi:MAG: 2-C-methyl-D-erythritol 4-phosphate cytidylyltransferase [Actinomycetota bacterium]